jgi:hypothetical protein
MRYSGLAWILCGQACADARKGHVSFIRHHRLEEPEDARSFEFMKRVSPKRLHFVTRYIKRTVTSPETETRFSGTPRVCVHRACLQRGLRCFTIRHARRALASLGSIAPAAASTAVVDIPFMNRFGDGVTCHAGPI